MLGDFLCDETTGDIIIKDGDFLFTETNIQSLAQRLEMRLNVWQGEWAYNEAFGTPYRQRIIGGGVTKAQVDAEFVRQVKLENDIIAIKELTSVYNQTNRLYQLTRLIVETQEGEVNVNLNFERNSEYLSPDFTTEPLCTLTQRDQETELITVESETDTSSGAATTLSVSVDTYPNT